MKKIAIQGIEGAFHDEAARAYFKTDLEIIPSLTFEDVVQSVLSGDADQALMAIENTISGTILQNFRILASHPIQIVGEIKMRIVQCLGALRGTQVTDLKEVRSHYMALNQCDEYLSTKDLKQIAIEDTALGAKQIAQKKLSGVGAIGSKTAMEIYNLDVLAESIETNKNNFTRFYVLQKASTTAAIGNKFTAQVILDHRSGSLAKLLTDIEHFDINLTKIESTPIIGKPWQYSFFLEGEKAAKLDKALITACLQKHAHHHHIIGIYTKHDESI